MSLLTSSQYCSVVNAQSKGKARSSLHHSEGSASPSRHCSYGASPSLSALIQTLRVGLNNLGPPRCIAL
jgi:hypothetical protein